MRKLTDHERTALCEIGPPGEGPVPHEVFDELVRLEWGYWADGFWFVTAAGSEALRLDDLARMSS
jgi:hypothetical protein